MELKPFERLALIGPSGCGKSTFLRCLNRLHEEVRNTSVKGEVLFEGKNIYSSDSNPVEIRSQIGMVFQKANPFPSMSIFENVVAGLKIRGERNKSFLQDTAKHCLEKAALWEEVKDKLSESGLSLSGGQQQRLCIARSLAVKPKVLLMDEPTSALDPLATAKIEELMLELSKDLSLMVVTHNMQQAQRIADRTAFFLLGEMVELDLTRNIFQNPRNEKTQHYIAGKFG